MSDFAEAQTVRCPGCGSESFYGISEISSEGAPRVIALACQQCKRVSGLDGSYGGVFALPGEAPR